MYCDGHRGLVDGTLLGYRPSPPRGHDAHPVLVPTVVVGKTLRGEGPGPGIATHQGWPRDPDPDTNPACVTTLVPTREIVERSLPRGPGPGGETFGPEEGDISVVVTSGGDPGPFRVLLVHPWNPSALESVPPSPVEGVSDPGTGGGARLDRPLSPRLKSGSEQP